ncbi:MAG TPA: hypothetical protein VK140_05760 [Ktedonobacteraceae bacterium]|nr:hypothetical protein [Ktedonobacteraceae bacterium]
MQDEKELQQQPSTTQGKGRFTSGMISLVFASLSVIMFVCTLLSAHHVQSLQAALDSQTPYVGAYWDAPEYNGIQWAYNLALIFLVAAGVATLVAIVSGNRALRSGNQREKRLGIISLVVLNLSLVLMFGSCWSLLNVSIWRFS